MAYRTQEEAVEAFYAADERRRRSPETGYGVFWSDGQTRQRYRVTYVRDTGEVFAVGEYPPVADVEVLGVVPADDVEEGAVYYRTLDSMLPDWTSYCRPGVDGLQWIRQQLREG